MDLNVCALSGEVIKKGELKEIKPSGTKTIELTLKNHGYGRNADGKIADFFHLEAWREKAEAIADRIQEGDKITVTGRIKYDRWTTPEGEKRSTYRILVNEFHKVNE